jgi:hypothetical protein
MSLSMERVSYPFRVLGEYLNKEQKTMLAGGIAGCVGIIAYLTVQLCIGSKT